MWTADDVGLAIVLLALVFLAAALIRKWSRHLRALFLPTAVIGGFLALALFDFSDRGGALIEVSFAGGHGTLAGLGPVFEEYGAGELVDVGLGLATIGMVTGVVVGTVLVNYAIRSPSIPVARQNPTSPDEDLDIDHHLPRPGQEPMDEWQGMSQVTAAAVALGVAIAVGIVLLEFFRRLFDLFGSDFFEKFPLFPFVIVAGVLVQLVAVRSGFAWALNRRAIEGLGGLSIDGIIICAIGTLSLGALGDNVGPLVILAAASVAWSVVLVLVIGRRVFEREWFERSIAEFGEGQGNVATGFMMVDMVDPARQTGVARGYSYRQLFTRPFIGGGFISALSVPFIAAAGLSIFTIVAVVVTVGLTIWGMRRAALGQSAFESAS